jgi:hypothetical protein
MSKFIYKTLQTVCHYHKGTLHLFYLYESIVNFLINLKWIGIYLSRIKTKRSNVIFKKQMK